MTPEEILSFPPKILTQEQREHYFEFGFVGVEDLVPSETLKLIKKYQLGSPPEEVNLTSPSMCVTHHLIVHCNLA